MNHPIPNVLSLSPHILSAVMIVGLLGPTTSAQRIQPQRGPGGRVPGERVTAQQPDRVKPDQTRKPDRARGQSKAKADLNRREKLKRRVGLVEAQNLLDQPLPTGRDVVIGHVEGQSNHYTPRINQARFGQISFVTHSGQSKPSGHANAVAKRLYGKDGLAPGVRQVHLFAASDFLGKGYLNTGQATAPKQTPIDVFNHSWIGQVKGKEAAVILRRVDYAIDANDVLMCVGVNNGRKTSVPSLLGSSYNAIAVGQAAGNSSGGYTQIEGKGRTKPDIVAPGGKTSFTTPVITAISARLLEAARSMDGTDQQARTAGTSRTEVQGDTQSVDTDSGESSPIGPAEHSELIKAVLLAGAVKPGGWSPEEGRPLDEHLGAGMVNAGHSLRILTRGQAGPGRVRQRFGWDFAQAHTQSTTTYRFRLRRELGPASFILTWNRRIDGRTVKIRIKDRDKTMRGWINAPHLADFDLELRRIADDGSTQTIAASRSRIDNVEHVYLPTLEPGQYQMQVIRHNEEPNAEQWDYALAWRLNDEVGSHQARAN